METNPRLKKVYSAARAGKVEDVRKFIVSSKLSKEERCDWFCRATVDKQKLAAQWILYNGFLPQNQPKQTQEGTAATIAKDEIIEVLMKKVAKADAFPASLFMDLAVNEGNEKLVTLLLSKGADVHSKVSGPFTAIQLAVMKGHPKIVEALLAGGSDANSTFKGSTLLHAAVFGGNDDTTASLLKHGAQVDAKRADGSTALFTAFEKDFLKVAKRLIDAGADLNAKIASTDKMDPLTKKFVDFQENALKLFRDDPDDCPASFQQLHPIKRQSSEKDLTLLHVAAYNGNEKHVELLVQSGADVNAKSNFHKTPLYFAAMQCHEGVVKLLRENGADIEILSAGKKTTLLHYIAVGDSLRSAKLLLKYGANVNAVDSVGQTPLHVAAILGQAGMTSLLLKYGADASAKDIVGWTPLVYAAYFGHLEVANVLLNFGASSVFGDFRAEPAFQMAIRRRHEQLMILFMAKLGYGFVDASGLSKEEKSNMLLSETGNFHIRSVEALLQSGADVNTVDSSGRTALHIAAQKCYHEIVELLLDYGADTELKTKRGRTALFLSVFEPPFEQFLGEFVPQNVAKQPSPDRKKTVKALLKFSANMHAADNDGMTPLKVAVIQHEKQARALEIFLKYGSASTHIVSESDVRGLFEEFNRDDVPPEFNPPYPRAHGVPKFALTASEVLVEHAILMKTANIYVGDEALVAKKFNYPDIRRRFQRVCECDVRKMKDAKVGNTDVSFYDVLKSDVEQMVDLAKNENIARALNGYDCEKKFALYGAILNSQFEKVKVRDFLKKGIKTCHFLFNRFRPVPYGIAEMIAFRYIGRKHLRILTEFAVDLDLGFDLFQHLIQT